MEEHKTLLELYEDKREEVERLKQQNASLPRIGSGEVATEMLDKTVCSKDGDMILEGTLDEIWIRNDRTLGIITPHNMGPGAKTRRLRDLYSTKASFEATMKENANKTETVLLTDKQTRSMLQLPSIEARKDCNAFAKHRRR